MEKLTNLIEYSLALVVFYKFHIVLVLPFTITAFSTCYSFVLVTEGKNTLNRGKIWLSEEKICQVKFEFGNVL